MRRLGRLLGWTPEVLQLAVADLFYPEKFSVNDGAGATIKPSGLSRKARSFNAGPAAINIPWHVTIVTQ